MAVFDILEEDFEDWFPWIMATGLVLSLVTASYQWLVQIIIQASGILLPLLEITLALMGGGVVIYSGIQLELGAISIFFGSEGEGVKEHGEQRNGLVPRVGWLATGNRSTFTNRTLYTF